MAEAIARSIAGPTVTFSSAGLAATGAIADETVSALRRHGYSADGLSSTSIDAADLAAVDVVVSLIGPSGLSWLPRNLGLETMSWDIPDPYGEDEAVYEAVVRMLEPRVRTLVQSLEKRAQPSWSL
jgi:protein-tyrosine-phosphatase